MAKSRKKDTGMANDRGAVAVAPVGTAVGTPQVSEARAQISADVGAPQSSGDTTAAALDRERLAARAYELYVARGRSDGSDMEDWLAAERELRDAQSRRSSES
jgi:hypothetical protein